MKKLLIIGWCMCITQNLVLGQAPHLFEIKDGNFVYDGKAIQIHSGEMHYARVPKPYWRQRLKMMKAMGLNTVCTYVFWNYHEATPGTWDFTTGNKNINEFIKIAGEEGLFVILRPGPYACAEWEFGGFPWWLLTTNGLKIRSDNQPFLDSCKNYFEKLAIQVRDLQVTHGGPVIMVQAENEFGSYVAQEKNISLEDHRKYSAAVKQMLIDVGFDVPLFTSDGSSLFAGGTIPGVLPTANGETDISNLKKAVDAFHEGKGPYMVGEYYPGWLDHWGEKFETVSTKEVVAQAGKYLDAGISFNFYMVHGGTNFGFTSGANYNRDHDLQPDITSYDYDAPISEAGWATAKFLALRELFSHYVQSLPPIPAAPPVISIPGIKISKSVDLFSFKDNMKPVVDDTCRTFEALNQGPGYILYSRLFEQGVAGNLEIRGLRDYAIVYVNRQEVAVLNRNQNSYNCSIDIPAGGTLDIFVENMGRINYGKEIVNNLKGIISPVLINNLEVKGNWQMYSFPMEQEPVIDSYTTSYTAKHPVIYSGDFELSKTGDSFIDMKSWGKGIVFVNGYNLGRYWSIGPQQTLYLPGCWLREGKNAITVFEQLNDQKKSEIHTVDKPELSSLHH